jgi:glycerol-3-phosphate dehydrogenase (NAD(P)+)
MQRQDKESVLVIGAGNFGTCLAQHLAINGHKVMLWAREPEIRDSISSNHRNPKYLREIPLSHDLTATCDLSPTMIKKYSIVVLAVPTQFLRSVLEKIRKDFPREILLVSAVKGMEIETGKLPDQIVADVLGPGVAQDLVALSGPSFAIEVALKLPTAVTMAGRNKSRVEWGQRVFHAPFFRVYASSDIIGLEVAGALKNVIAIASGACEGLGFQANSRAALITRGLAEITRAGVALGANPLTFKGLSGVGDLFLTCTSEKSRNFTVGYRLGRGEKLADILATLGSVAEGVHTAKSAYSFGQKLHVDLPIALEVYRVLYEDKPIKEAVLALLNREAKAELDSDVVEKD